MRKTYWIIDKNTAYIERLRLYDKGKDENAARYAAKEYCDKTGTPPILIFAPPLVGFPDIYDAEKAELFIAEQSIG